MSCVCPRCKGNKNVMTFTIVNGQRTGESDWMPCPTCHATGEADEKDCEDYHHYMRACTPFCTCGDDGQFRRFKDSVTGRDRFHCIRCGRNAKIQKGQMR